MNKTLLFIFTALLLVTSCAQIAKKKKSERVPASVSSQSSEADDFFNAIENAPASRY